MSTINELIKRVREKEGLSVSELADGVCTKKYIYLIEKHERTPSHYILHEFNKKFKTDLFELLHFMETSDPILYAEIHRKLIDASNRNDIFEIQRLLLRLPDEPCDSIELKQFFLSMKGITVLYIDNDKKECKTIIEKGLELTNKKADLKSIDYEHLTISEAYLYCLLVSYKRYAKLNLDLEHDLSPFIHFLENHNDQESINILFLLSIHKFTILFEKKQYNEILNFADRIGITLSSSQTSIYNIYYFKALALFHLGDYKDSERYCLMALELCRVYNLDFVHSKCKALLSEIKIKTEIRDEFRILHQVFIPDTVHGQSIGIRYFDNDLLFIDINHMDNSSITQLKVLLIDFINRTALPTELYIVINMEKIQLSKFTLDLLSIVNFIECIGEKLKKHRINHIRVINNHAQSINQALGHLDQYLSHTSFSKNYITSPSENAAFKLIQVSRQF